MRIQATVEVVNRDVNMRTKPVRSSLALGKKPLADNKKNDSSDPKVFLVLSTQANRVGTKFAIVANVEKVFNKCVDDGKTTLRIIQPPKDIVISKANPIELKAFLGVLKQILFAKNDDDLDKVKLTASALNPASLAQVSKPKDKLVITEKKDYPITKNFPLSLKDLRATGVNLKRLDRRILKLSNLVRLDLSDNAIPDLPDGEEFKHLVNLKELVLSGNKLTTLPMSLFRSSVLSKNLCLLDVSRNSLKILPNAIANFVNLVTLNLAGNPLERLAVTLDKLPRLKRLDLSGNDKLRVLPGSLIKLRLDHLVLSSSALTQLGGSVTLSDSSKRIPCLRDLCIGVCDQNRMRSQVDEELLPGPVLAFWDTMQRCHCDRICHWSSHARAITKANPKSIAITLISDSGLVGSNAMIRCETLFCSTKCLDLYKHKQLNYR